MQGRRVAQIGQADMTVVILTMTALGVHVRYVALCPIKSHTEHSGAQGPNEWPLGGHSSASTSSVDHLEALRTQGVHIARCCACADTDGGVPVLCVVVRPSRVCVTVAHIGSLAIADVRAAEPLCNAAASLDLTFGSRIVIASILVARVRNILLDAQ